MSLKALKASIAHWEANVRAASPEEASVSRQDCALCTEYFDEYDWSCRTECPVRQATGRGNCRATPYDRASEVFSEWEPKYHETTTDWREAAQDELDFLMSLLPEEETTA